MLIRLFIPAGITACSPGPRSGSDESPGKTTAKPIARRRCASRRRIERRSPQTASADPGGGGIVPEPSGVAPEFVGITPEFSGIVPDSAGIVPEPAELQADVTLITGKKGEQTDDRIGDIGGTAETAGQISKARKLIKALNTSVRNKFRNDPVVLAK